MPEVKKKISKRESDRVELRGWDPKMGTGGPGWVINDGNPAQVTSLVTDEKQYLAANR